jgi:hypothetical protein
MGTIATDRVDMLALGIDVSRLWCFQLAKSGSCSAAVRRKLASTALARGGPRQSSACIAVGKAA